MEAAKSIVRTWQTVGLENKGKVAFSYLSACYFLWFGL
jgi:hypothetical protein